MYDEAFMRRAIALSARALTEPGTGPFAAVVVRAGVIVGEGVNRAQANFDPTSHGEVEAIRNACARLKTTDLTGCELYTSCEPCALCVAAMLIAGIARIYYGATLQQSDRLVPRGAVIPADDLRRETGLPIGQRAMPAEQKLDAEAVTVLEQWGASRSP